MHGEGATGINVGTDSVPTLRGYLLAYNLIPLLMARAALLADQIPRQLSFKQGCKSGWPGRNAGAAPMRRCPSTPRCS